MQPVAHHGQAAGVPQRPARSRRSTSLQVGQAGVAQPTAQLASALVQAGTAPAASGRPLPSAAYVNALGLLERTDFALLYHATRIDVDPERVGFPDAGRSEHCRPMIDGAMIVVWESFGAARQRGRELFGNSGYKVFSIEATGLPAVAVNENLERKFDQLCGHLGRRPQAMIDQVHLSNAGLTVERIHLAFDARSMLGMRGRSGSAP